MRSYHKLSSSCSTFTTSITPILSSRSRLALVRSHIASIEDVLSIPRLVSTCVRGGWWTEAMDLAYRARDLEQILRPSAKSALQHSWEPGKPSRRDLLGKVREEVDVEVKTLRARIIEGLRGRDLKLPGAVRSISLLRRISQSEPGSSAGATIGALGEPELRLTFLASRWDCLRSQLEQIEVTASAGGSSEERMRYLKRWVEVWREVVGDTVGIYGEIFLSPASGEATLAVEVSQLELHDPYTPLPIFLSQSLQVMRRLLEAQLPQITSIASLASLQTQLSYCSAAFSKFGFEFRQLPNSLINARVRNVTEERFNSATATFAKDTQRALTMSGARGGKARFVPGALIGDDNARASILSLDEATLPPSDAKHKKAAHARQWQTSQPPSYITFFPPLARLLNGHAQALNELRLLPLAALYPALRAQQAATLTSCVEDLSNIATRALQALNNAQWSPNPDAEFREEQEAQSTILRRFALVLVRTVVPWCRWALRQGVFPDIDSQEEEGYNNVVEHELYEAILALLHVVGLKEEEAESSEQPDMPQSNGTQHHVEEEVQDASARQAADDVDEAAVEPRNPDPNGALSQADGEAEFDAKSIAKSLAETVDA